MANTNLEKRHDLKIIMKGGDAYKILLFRQRICSDVAPLGFQVGGAR